MKSIDDDDLDDSVDPSDYDEDYDESEAEDEELDEKKKKMGFFLSATHLVFGIVVLVLLLGAVGAVGYSMQRYNNLNTDVIEKSVTIESQAKQLTDLQGQVTQLTKERDDIKAEKEALAEKGDSGEVQKLLNQKNTELIQTKTDLHLKAQELTALKIVMNQTSNRDAVVEEFRVEYNIAVDRLYDDLNKACIEAVDEVLGDNKGSENKKDLKKEIAREVDIEDFKAGLFNVTN